MLRSVPAAKVEATMRDVRMGLIRDAAPSVVAQRFSRTQIGQSLVSS